MPKHDFVTMDGRWLRPKPLTEEELNEEFKKSKFKSHHAFLAYKTYGRGSFEVEFWEWMETTSTKYDKDGNVYRKRPGKPGFIYRWLLSEFSPKFNIIMLTLLGLMIWFFIIMNIF